MTGHTQADEFQFGSLSGAPDDRETVFVPRTRVLADSEVREIFEQFQSRDTDLPMDILPVAGTIGRHTGGIVSWTHTLTCHAPIGFFISLQRMDRRGS